MKNIIFSSKSYDRKGKVYESLEHHNRDVATPFRQEKFEKMKIILTHFSEVPTIFSGLILPGIGRSIALEAVPSLELGVKATPMFTTWVLT